MVNIDQFAERLNIVMNYYSLSAALFAEKIDVQRSSISHILSGRNKPSLEFVLKILKVFPEVELYWLLNGVGTFPKQVSKKIESAPTLFSEEKEMTTVNKEITSVKSPIESEHTIVNSLKSTTTNEIERIVIFFKDGSFKNYNP